MRPESWSAVAGPQQPRMSFVVGCPRLSAVSGGGSRHEEGLARKRRVGGANRKPRARGRLARDRTNLRGCTPARRVQLVDRLLLGRQFRRRLGTTWLHPRQLRGG